MTQGDSRVIFSPKYVTFSSVMPRIVSFSLRPWKFMSPLKLSFTPSMLMFLNVTSRRLPAFSYFVPPTPQHCAFA